jgi:hypothetical protein
LSYLLIEYSAAKPSFFLVCRSVTDKDVEPVLTASQSKKAPESFPGALPFKSTNQSFFSNGPGGTQPVRGSFIVGTGGGDAIVVEPLLVGETCLVRWKK